MDVKTKELKERLGDPAQLPSIEETKANIDKRLIDRMQSFTAEIRNPKSESTATPAWNRCWNRKQE